MSHVHTYALVSTTAGQQWVCACGGVEPINNPVVSTTSVYPTPLTPTPEAPNAAE